MNPNDFINMMKQGGQASYLKRQPTVQELDKFIDLCMEKADYNLYMLFQDISCKLQPPNNNAVVLSVYEVEIYPLVLQRIKQRIGGFV